MLFNFSSIADFLFLSSPCLQVCENLSHSRQEQDLEEEDESCQKDHRSVLQSDIGGMELILEWGFSGTMTSWMTSYTHCVNLCDSPHDSVDGSVTKLKHRDQTILVV